MSMQILYLWYLNTVLHLLAQIFKKKNVALHFQNPALLIFFASFFMFEFQSGS